jgi:hypothetical protein
VEILLHTELDSTELAERVEVQKIVTKSLAEGNAQILIKIFLILLSFDKLSYQKYSKPYDFVKGNSCGPLLK